MLVHHGRGATVDSKQTGTRESTEDQDWTAHHLVAKRHAHTGTNGRQTAVQDVESELLGCRGDTDSVKDGWVEVAKTVSGELAERAHHDDLQESPAAIVLAEQRAVVPPDLVNAILANALLHLLDLKHDQTGRWVPIAVVFDQEGDGLLLLAVGHLETWRLWQEEDRAKDNDTGEALKQQGDSP